MARSRYGENDTFPGASVLPMHFHHRRARRTSPSVHDVDAPLAGWRHIVCTQNQVLGLVVLNSVVEGVWERRSGDG